jgi:large subunit ribosomal protein L3
MVGIIGTKIGMTSILDANGNKIAVTVVKAEPNVVSQVKTMDVDGYKALQLSAFEINDKHGNKARKGHFAKASSPQMKYSHEFRLDAGNENIQATIGDQVDVSIFNEGDWVDVIGTSKGKGFQGVVKRHNFGGVGPATHGQHDRARAPGSVGASSYPSKVFKGIRMAGRMGGKRIMNINNRVVRVIPEENLIILTGSISGHKGATVIIEK